MVKYKHYMLCKYKHSSLFYHHRRNSEFSKNTPSRLKASLLLLLIFVSVITTLPILQSTSASALTMYDDSNPTTFDSQIQAFLYYDSISYCFKEGNALNDGSMFSGRYITNEHASGGQWFLQGSYTTGLNKTLDTSIGAYMKDASVKSGDANISKSGWIGKTPCSNPNLISGAMSVWGLDPIEVLCNSGFQRIGLDLSGQSDDQKIKNCVKETGYNLGKIDGADNYKLFTNYVKKEALGIKDDAYPWLTDAQMYEYYIGTLNNSCISSIDMVNTSPSSNKSTLSTGYNDVNWYNKTTDTVEHGTYTGWDNGTLIYIRNQAGPDFGSYSATCRLIASKISDSEGKNQYALAYQKAWSEYKAIDAAAAAQALKDEQSEKEKEKPTSGSSSCTVSGVGWIICPVVNFLSGLADGMFDILTRFLSTSPDIFTFKDQTTGLNPTFNAWSAMRSIANVAFVIAFLIIIFSQITSVGITNYGIKKLLPRLVIAAILVNISYYICQIAVDLSNILGFSLQSFMVGLIPGVTDTTGVWSGGTWTSILGYILVAGVAMTSVMLGALAFFIPAILAAIVALIMILFILIARQALIILLIVISPLAFVAFLLPNTSDWFKKWQEAFTTMLLLFPIVAMVFGASKLASGILKNVYTTDTIGQIAAAAILVVPLFVVPGLLKKALDGVGSLGTKMNGWGDKLGSMAGKKGSEVYDNTALARGIAARNISKNNFRDRKFAKDMGKDGWRKRAARGIFPNMTEASRFADARLERSSLATSNEADAKDVTAQQTLLESQILAGTTTSDQAFKDAVTKNDAVGARAAMAIQLQTKGGRDRAHDLVKDAGSNSQFVSSGGMSKLQGHVAGTNPALGDKDAALGNWSHNLSDGNLNNIEKDKATFDITDTGMAGQSFNNLNLAYAAGVLDETKAARILDTPALTKDIKDAERAYLTKIAGREGITPPTINNAPSGSGSQEPSYIYPDDHEGPRIQH